MSESMGLPELDGHGATVSQAACSQAIESFLCRYGWSFERSGDRSWLSGWHGASGSRFSLLMDLGDIILTLRVTPLFAYSVDVRRRPDLLAKIVDANRDTPMVKVVLEDDNSVGLMMQMLAGHLTYEDFANGLGILAHFAETMRADGIGAVDTSFPESWAT